MITLNNRVVLDALLPAGDLEDLPGVFEAGFEDWEKDFSADAPLTMRVGWRAALFVAYWISPVLITRLPPLARLSADERENALEAMGKSRFYLMRQCFLLLKAVTSFGYGSTARVRKAVGY